MKIVIDNEHPDTYYDGDSMGGGLISFPCGSCGKVLSKETFYFWKENKDQKGALIKDFEACFSIPEKEKHRKAIIGLLKCTNCNSVHAAHIDYGEVSSCHWQSRLHKVVMCDS